MFKVKKNLILGLGSLFPKREFFLKTMADYNCSSPPAFKCQRYSVDWSLNQKLFHHYQHATIIQTICSIHQIICELHLIKSPIRLFHHFVLEISLIKQYCNLARAFWPISQELDFSQGQDLCNNTANNINFLYRPNSEKKMTKFSNKFQKPYF